MVQLTPDLGFTAEAFEEHGVALGRHFRGLDRNGTIRAQVGAAEDRGHGAARHHVVDAIVLDLFAGTKLLTHRFTGNSLSSARFSISTLTRGSPRKPSCAAFDVGIHEFRQRACVDAAGLGDARHLRRGGSRAEVRIQAAGRWR